MKKNLFIVRHGHSELSAESDFERTLTKNGVHAVKRTADLIHQTCKKEEITIEACMCSAAVRTQQTANIICHKNNIQSIFSHQDLYSSVASNWLDKISKLEQENIVLVGHNPTLSQMINYLCGKNIYMKPANCALISLEINADGITYPAKLIKYYNYE